MSFLDKLDLLMRERNLNKHQLSQATGIPYSTIDSFYKKGYENTKLSTLQRLAEYFEVSLDVLTDSDNYNDENEEIGHYLDEETAKIAQEIYENPDLRILFDTTRKVKPDDLKLIAEMVKRMSGDND